MKALHKALQVRPAAAGHYCSCGVDFRLLTCLQQQGMHMFAAPGCAPLACLQKQGTGRQCSTGTAHA